MISLTVESRVSIAPTVSLFSSLYTAVHPLLSGAAPSDLASFAHHPRNRTERDIAAKIQYTSALYH